MEFISDEALDEQEYQQADLVVSSLMWLYGLTHPAMLALLFVGGTLGRRARKIQKKVKARREGPPKLASVTDIPKPEKKPEAPAT